MEDSIQKRANAWLLGDDTGMSSKMLAAHMLGLKPARNTPPTDASDRGRCIRLLEIIPEWIERLDEMKKYPDVVCTYLTGHSLNVMERRNEGWSHQVELIKTEMNR